MVKISVFSVQAGNEKEAYAWYDGTEAVDERGRWWMALGKAWFKAKIKMKFKVKSELLRSKDGVYPKI